MAAQLVALGFLALLGQVVLLGEATVAAYGNELAVVLALGLWLLGAAVGAAAGARLTRPSPALATRLFALAGALIPLAVVWSRAARPLLGGVRGGYLPFPLQLVAMAVTLVPAAAAGGALFPALARLASAGGLGVARAYALESAGALLGGLAAAAASRLGVPGLLLALACAAAVPLALLARDRRAAAAGAAALLALLAALAPRLDLATTGWTHPGLVETRDTPYGRLTLEEHAGQVTVFVNDALAYETQGPSSAEFASLAALQAADPRRVLVLGGGACGLVRELLRHGPREVTAVDLDPALQLALAPRLPADLRAALADPRVHAVTADPRAWLARDAGAWDLIVIGLPEPASGATNRFFTQEFFALCAGRLAPGGALALRLPAAENLWAPALVNRTASVVAALRAAGTDALVLPGAAGIIVAAKGTLPRDPDLLAARLTARDASGPLVTPAYLRYLYTNDRLAGIATELAAANAPANCDARPVCYPYTLALWLAKFYPALARLDSSAATGSLRALWPAATAALVALVLLGRRLRRRSALAVAAAGAAGMLIEALALLAFQTRHGALYRDLGLLLAAFMAGLAAGALAADLSPIEPGRGGRTMAARWRAAAPSSALALLATLFALRLRAGAAPGLPEASLWLASTGALTAAVFGLAARRASAPSRAAGPLYAADLLGGCLGSLAGSLLLIPLAGLPATALAAAALALAAAAWS
jgi:spermidine synthase